MEILDKTLAVCEENLKPVSAKVVEDDGKIFLEKECGEIEEIWQKIRKRVFTTALYITSRCNLSCPICYLNFAHSMHDMSMGELKGFLKKNKSRFISLTGGEPTVRKDLPEIIKFLKSKGKVVYIITNGIKLADRRYLKKLKEAGLDGVYLSFDGFDEETYLKFREEKLLEKKLKALKNLKKEGIDTILTPVISECNKNQIKLIVDYACKHRFIEGIRFLSEYPKKLSSLFIVKEISKEYGITLDYFIKVRKFLWKFHCLPRFLQNFLCIDFGGFPFKRGSLKPLSKLDLIKEGLKFLLTRLGIKNDFGILKIYTCSIYTPLSWDFKQAGMIFSESNEGFEKIKRKFPIQAMVGIY